MSRPTSSHPRSRPGSSLKGGAATPVTLTARLTLEGEHVLTLEEWIGQELQRTHGRVKDERILFSGAAAAAPVPVPVPVPLTVPRAAPSTGASMRLAPREHACFWPAGEHWAGVALIAPPRLAGSRDGFSNQAFHENCDGCSPTVTIVLLHDGRSREGAGTRGGGGACTRGTEREGPRAPPHSVPDPHTCSRLCRVFGGYTSIPWSSISGPHPDPEAFLFSLTDGTPVAEGGRPSCRLFQVG
jgi:hypothetical protein